MNILPNIIELVYFLIDIVGFIDIQNAIIVNKRQNELTNEWSMV